MVTDNDDKQNSELNISTERGGGNMDKSRYEAPKKITIEVNNHKVEMLDGPATGLEIKEEAIRQGVGIQPNFMLQVELPNGTGKVIGDNDKILLREHLSFTAIAPDDNS